MPCARVASRIDEYNIIIILYSAADDDDNNNKTMNRIICLCEIVVYDPFGWEGRPSVDGRREHVVFRAGQPTSPWRRGGACIYA